MTDYRAFAVALVRLQGAIAKENAMRRPDPHYRPLGAPLYRQPYEGCDEDLLGDPPIPAYADSTVARAQQQGAGGYGRPDYFRRTWTQGRQAAQAIGDMARACRPWRFQKTG